MRVENLTPYPDAEVRRIVTRAYSGRGARPARVIVRYQPNPRATLLGFTPYDKRLPTELWVEPPNRYPQPGARSWRELLFDSAAHEASHFRHGGHCPHGACERDAEAYAQGLRRTLGLGRAVAGRP